jgi:hypothetical protein
MDNARLSLLNQGAVVAAMASLANAIRGNRRAPPPPPPMRSTETPTGEPHGPASVAAANNNDQAA